MGNFDYKKWVTENKYGKLNEVEDLELKSLAKKFIPIMKNFFTLNLPNRTYKIF